MVMGVGGDLSTGGDQPLRLQAEDVEFERAVQGMLRGDYKDWPNEAGFEGLDEIRGPVELTVRGTIPAWAAGILYRTGPGQYTIADTLKGTFHTTHWFDGFGHTHKFNIIADPDNAEAPVRVEYSSRRQTQTLIDAVKKEGRRPDICFGQRRDPCIGIFGKIMSVWEGALRTPQAGMNNVCVTIQAPIPSLSAQAGEALQSGYRGVNKTLWLATDAQTMKEFDQHTLEPIGVARQRQLHPLLSGPLSCAHAQRDPDTGDFFNYNAEMGRIPTYRVFRTSVSTGETDILATIHEHGVKPAYIHSFFLSPSFAILCVPSSHLGMMGLKVTLERNLADAIEPFDESKLWVWFVVDRRGSRGVVGRFHSPAGFFFHSINSFEEYDDETGDVCVFCDFISYPTLQVIRAFEMDVLLQNHGATENFWGDEERNQNCQARLTRLKFPIPRSNSPDKPDVLAPERPAEKVLEIRAPRAGELPTINPTNSTKKYRYVYSLANRGRSTLFDSIVKTDLVTREAVYWENPRGHTPGEAIFVPRPSSHVRGQGGETGTGIPDEDDGVLLSVVLDGIGKKSYLLCLDARTMKELGRAECDFAVAFGFHGLYSAPPAVERES
ncbi:carotenoid oxygenase [Durotheca rogersii]|uniref:carotenoid oxygenase n=1 Tax=Durotheca rogersii TaxID=419775 RepID=UPI0022206361|nr:carotenoid oxygenase [Durotheca rogersii]KAI5860804.1 carotenoid oxygenase [Durotheca rogersii]